MRNASLSTCRLDPRLEVFKTAHKIFNAVHEHMQVTVLASSREDTHYVAQIPHSILADVHAVHAMYLQAQELLHSPSLSGIRPLASCTQLEHNNLPITLTTASECDNAQTKRACLSLNLSED